MEISDADRCLAFDFEYLVPSSSSVSSASSSAPVQGQPQGMLGLASGGEFYRGGH